jgi:quercetin dioxygenase-like cupin family protein
MGKSRVLALSMGVISFMTLAMPVVRAQDMVKVAPKNCKVLLDNDRVRVIRVVTKPGEKIEMHSHPANITYALTSGKVKFTLSDGKTEEREMKAGQAIWSEAASHSADNIGTTEARVVVIELKK